MERTVVELFAGVGGFRCGFNHITFDGNKFALRSIPSGIFNPNIKNVMANGMVIDPKQMLEELHSLMDRGIKNFRLHISNRAHVVLPYHVLIDGAYESLKGDSKIGTTKRGIGPCYADKVNRIGIRIADFVDEKISFICFNSAGCNHLQSISTCNCGITAA